MTEIEEYEREVEAEKKTTDNPESQKIDSTPTPPKRIRVSNIASTESKSDPEEENALEAVLREMRHDPLYRP